MKSALHLHAPDLCEFDLCESRKSPAFRASVVSLLLAIMLFSGQRLRADEGGVATEGVDGAAAGEFSAAELEFFEREVRPLLAAQCFACHSQSSETAEGGLQLDSREAVLAGGSSGPAAVPFQEGESRILQAIAYQGGLEMPPSEPLSGPQQEVLRRWVAMGLPWSPQTAHVETFDLETRRQTHWAWQAPAGTAPPPTVDRQWGRGGIDQFILQALEENGLQPAAPAPSATLLRRLAMDLIGLPPTAEERDRFMADKSPYAVSRQIDRYLADPQMGVRWGRHWLDLVRYAETYGHEFDYPIPHVSHYRNWVVAALNADLPYDQFATEQIAGDMLATPRLDPVDGTNQSLAGSAFWWLGDAVHAPVDARGDQAARVDNQIDVATKTFLAMTVTCARCHDHKFDAISQADYYALAGLLHGTTRSIDWLDPGGAVESQMERIIAAHRALRDAVGAVVPPSPVVPRATPDPRIIFDFSDPQTPRGTAVGWAFRSVADPYLHADLRVRGDLANAPTLTFEPAGWIDSQRYGSRARGVWRSAPFEIKTAGLAYRVIGDGGGEIRLVIDGHFMIDFHQLLFGGTKFNPQTAGQWQWHVQRGDLRHYIGHTAHVEIIDGGDGYVGLAELRWLADDQGPPSADDPRGVVQSVPWESVAATAEPELRRFRECAEGLPAPPVVLASAALAARDIPLAIRGNPHEVGPVVPRGDLAAFAHGDVDAARDSSVETRLDLARRWASAENPLFARVAVNRVWHRLLGRGLVEACDNFGVLGGAPTHRELLDYLALDLVGHGWSSKRLMREVLLSQTYAMSAAKSAAAAEKDPANTLLHSARLRRLEGEVIRDVALQLAGHLDRQIGGGSVPIHLTEQMTGRGRPGHSGPLDGAGRRSLFLEVRRNFLSPMLLAFDTPIPFTTVGKRNISNVPSQALVMLNDPLIRQASQAWGARILTLPMEDDAARIESMYREALGRDPREDELRIALAFVRSGPPSQQGDVWRELAHALMNVKEFIFLP